MFRMSYQTNSVKLGHFNGLKGGTAPGELKAKFLNLFHEMRDMRLKSEHRETSIDEIHKLKLTCGMLWNCTDKVPREESRLILCYRKGLYENMSSDFSITYAQAARALRPHIDLLEKHANHRNAAVRATKSREDNFFGLELEDLLDVFFN